MKLNAKNVVVTGGGTGIGAGIARALAAEGCQVAIGGRREDKLHAVADAWIGPGAVRGHCLDVTDRSSVTDFFTWASQELGEIHVLVNAAGMNIRTRTMAAMTPEQWDQVLAVNATGAYNCMYAVLPQMRSRQDGLIINISSVAGKRALTLGGIAYCASKFAMTALGTCAGNEEAANGIRVTNIYPGEVNTPILDERPEPVSDARKAVMVQPEDFAELVVAIVGLHPRAARTGIGFETNRTGIRLTRCGWMPALSSHFLGQVQQNISHREDRHGVAGLVDNRNMSVAAQIHAMHGERHLGLQVQCLWITRHELRNRVISEFRGTRANLVQRVSLAEDPHDLLVANNQYAANGPRCKQTNHLADRYVGSYGHHGLAGMQNPNSVVSQTAFDFRRGHQAFEITEGLAAMFTQGGPLDVFSVARRASNHSTVQVSPEWNSFCKSPGPRFSRATSICRFISKS